MAEIESSKDIPTEIKAQISTDEQSMAEMEKAWRLPTAGGRQPFLPHSMRFSGAE
jgi:hypothetical protein